jgi:CRISPR-associated protein Cmr1
MKITLKTLTPLWTGGVGGTCDRLHETGIIGSLRWWYEAIVRGLDGWACDPTDNGCIYERKAGESHKKAYNRLCDACKLFGCTGWRRRFRLSTELGASQFATRFCLATLDRRDKFNHWWLTQVFADAIGTPLPLADVNMQVQFPPGAQSNEAAFTGLVSIMARFGGIGAKTQYGFGQFDWTGKLSAAEALEAIRNQLNPQTQHHSPQSADYYTLRNFWHLTCLIPETDPLINRFKGATLIGDKPTFNRLRERYLPVSFDLRYKLPGSDDGLRQAYRMSHGKMAAREVFGTLKGAKRGSRIFVSHLYKEETAEKHYHLNVWGFTKTSIGKEMRQQVKRMFTSANIVMTTGPQLLR